MTNNEAAKWIQLYIDLAKIDPTTGEAAIDTLDKIFPADPMRNDYTQGITCGAALATEYIKQLPFAQPPVLTCDGCRHVGTYDTDFPCSGCIRREKDYYEQER